MRSVRDFFPRPCQAFVISFPGAQTLSLRPLSASRSSWSPAHPIVRFRARQCTGAGGGCGNGSPWDRGGGDGDGGGWNGGERCLLAGFGSMGRRKSRRPLRMGLYNGSLFEGSPWARLQKWLAGLRVSDVLVGLNVVIFLLQGARGAWLLRWGAKFNESIAAGELWRLVTPIFLHSGFAHLFVNCYSLRNAGPAIEGWYGKQRFLTLYLFSGLTANVLSYACTPLASVGASGAIFGLVGAMSVFLVRHRKLVGDSWKAALQSTLWVIVMNFGIGMRPGSKLDNFGHLGGLIGGAAYAHFAGPRLAFAYGRNGRPVLIDHPISSVVMRNVRQIWRKLISRTGNLLQGK